MITRAIADNVAASAHDAAAVAWDAPDIETASNGYAARFSGQVGEYFLQRQTTGVLDLLERYPGSTVLDVGGGHGQVAIPLQQAGYRVSVTGSSPSCGNYLRNLSCGESLPFCCCSGLKLPFRENSFDIVVGVRLLAHLRNVEPLLAEMCRVARKAVIVDYPEQLSFNLLSGPLFGWKRSIEGNTRRFICLRTPQVARHLANSGFDRPVVKRGYFLPKALHRAVGRARWTRSVERLFKQMGLTSLFGSPVLMRVTAQQSGDSGRQLANEANRDEMLAEA